MPLAPKPIAVLLLDHKYEIPVSGALVKVVIGTVAPAHTFILVGSVAFPTVFDLFRFLSYVFKFLF